MTGRDITESQIIGSQIREVRIKKGMITSTAEEIVISELVLRLR